MPTSAHPAPPFDPELAPILTALAEFMPPTLTREMIGPMREAPLPGPPIAEIVAARNLVHTERTVPGPDGAPEITLSVFTRADHLSGGPGIYHIPGGGMIIGGSFQRGGNHTGLGRTDRRGGGQRRIPAGPGRTPIRPRSRTATPAWSGRPPTPTNSASIRRA